MIVKLNQTLNMMGIITDKNALNFVKSKISNRDWKFTNPTKQAIINSKTHIIIQFSLKKFFIMHPLLISGVANKVSFYALFK
ncbi:hypothetical protein R0K17_11695 [Planococcus sp. SIMBA_143]